MNWVLAIPLYYSSFCLLMGVGYLAVLAGEMERQ